MACLPMTRHTSEWKIIRHVERAHRTMSDAFAQAQRMPAREKHCSMPMCSLGDAWWIFPQTTINEGKKCCCIDRMSVILSQQVNTWRLSWEEEGRGPPPKAVKASCTAENCWPQRLSLSHSAPSQYLRVKGVRAPCLQACKAH